MNFDGQIWTWYFNHEVPGYIIFAIISRTLSLAGLQYHNRLWENPSEFREESRSVMICIITFQRGQANSVTNTLKASFIRLVPVG